MSDPDWELVPVELDGGRIPYADFLRRLDPYLQVVADTAVRTILASEGINVCRSEWGKPLGKGLYEFRIRRTLRTICNQTGHPLPAGLAADDPVLLRVFFAVSGRRVLLLLGGYDKGSEPSDRAQQREIKAARAVLTAYRYRASSKGRR